MSKIMLVNVTHVEESRVAVVDGGVLDAYEIETLNRAHIKGNIYNAVVDGVHPSLEAAFLQLTPELNGFLPIDEVNFKLLPPRGEGRRAGRIGQHLHKGQKIMAQVVREPFSGKPPTVSTYFSLPGRYLVLMPGVDSAGVSRKIEDADQRDRLKKIVGELRLPEGFGVIVRTAGLGQTKLELQRDLRYLLRLWQSVQRASRAREFPGMVYREADLVIRTIRDHLTSDISEVWIDSQETYDKALQFVRDVMPNRAKTLHLYSDQRPLFNKFNLEDQIETIYKRRVPLPSGGEIVIDGTEALTAIDVNSARSKRQGDAEENATRTNLEAAVEVARQFRLRDLGGLIVVDFIDMMSTRNKKKVEDEMRQALRGDKARYDVTRISKLGLMEIARQRMKGAKMGATYATCPACEGYGLIKNLEAAALSALRKLQTRSARGDFGAIRVGLPPDVATWMANHKRDDLLQIERRHRVRVDVDPRPGLNRHESKIETTPREKGDEPMPEAASDVVVSPPAPEPRAETPMPTSDEPQEPAAESSGPKRRRRRRRRPSGGAGTDGETLAARKPEAPPAPDEAPGSETKIVPFSSPEAQSPDEPAADESTVAEREEPRARRRRKRRRRPRQGDGEGRAESSAESQEPDTRQQNDRPEETVPRGIKSDELMPAAVGQTGGAKRRSPAPGTRRRRKTGARGPRTGGSSGGPGGGDRH